MQLSNGVNSELLNEVASLYDWLNRQTRRYYKPDSLCSACGNCCNFKQFEHLLFVTPPELIFLSTNLKDKLKQMTNDTCPYNLSAIVPMPSIGTTADLSASGKADEGGKPAIRTASKPATQMAGKCTVYDYRFSGCRIFCCNADKDFQSVLSESAIKKLKSICEKFEIPYNYTDLKTALENFT